MTVVLQATDCLSFTLCVEEAWLSPNQSPLDFSMKLIVVGLDTTWLSSPTCPHLCIIQGRRIIFGLQCQGRQWVTVVLQLLKWHQNSCLTPLCIPVAVCLLFIFRVTGQIPIWFKDLLILSVLMKSCIRLYQENVPIHKKTFGSTSWALLN